jgi:hypothetical protein
VSKPPPPTAHEAIPTVGVTVTVEVVTGVGSVTVLAVTPKQEHALTYAAALLQAVA